MAVHREPLDPQVLQAALQTTTVAKIRHAVGPGGPADCAGALAGGCPVVAPPIFRPWWTPRRVLISVIVVPLVAAAGGYVESAYSRLGWQSTEAEAGATDLSAPTTVDSGSSKATSAKPRASTSRSKLPKSLVPIPPAPAPSTSRTAGSTSAKTTPPATGRKTSQRQTPPKVTTPAPPVPPSTTSPSPKPTKPDYPQIAAVGDLACDPANPVFNNGEGTLAGCRQAAVADFLADQYLDALLTVGDHQMIDGSLEHFNQVFDRYFRQFRTITKPTPGNHDYVTADARGYFDYFGSIAHEDNPFGAPGNYSYDVGTWHLISINSILCTTQRPCNDDHPLMKWLKADLAEHKNQCTLAYWHHPLWSAGRHGSYTPMTPVWNTLLDAGVELTLHGHDHGYQRYAPLGRATAIAPGEMAPPVVLDEDTGMRQFIVGTGGDNNYRFLPDSDHPELAHAIDVKYSDPSIALFGALLIQLRPDSYSWKFEQVNTPGRASFADEGESRCHGAAGQGEQRFGPAAYPISPSDGGLPGSGAIPGSAVGLGLGFGFGFGFGEALPWCPLPASFDSPRRRPGRRRGGSRPGWWPR